MNKSQRTLKSAAIAVVFAVLASCGGGEHETPVDGAESTQAMDKLSVRLPIPIVESGQTTFYVAKDKGFYAEENLDVEFFLGSPDLNPVKMVATEQDEFGVLGGPDTLITARSRGQKLKAIAIIHRNSNFVCLVTLAQSGITQLEQLQGEKIGFNYGHISTDVLRNLLRENEIEHTEVDVGFDYAQLATGSINAQWAFTVTAGLDLPARGIDVNVISPADYGIVTHGYTIFTTEKLLNEQSELVDRFLRATLRGVEYTLENPEEANQILLSRSPDLDSELTLKRQLMYNAATSNSEEFPLGYMDREMFHTTYERLYEDQVIQDEFDISEVFTTSVLERIRETE